MARRATEAEILETTLGDLIAALVEETEPLVDSEKETNQLVALILADLLHNAGAFSENRRVILRKSLSGRSLVVH